jgi:hypothetical protein
MNYLIATLTTVLPILLAAVPPAAAAGAGELKCAELRPAVKSLKVMTMEPRRRGKAWLEGAPKTIFYTACDPRGLKTEEAEYQQKNLVLKTRFVHKSREDSKLICDALKSEEKLTSTFSEEARSSLDDFCRNNRKKDFDAVLVYDASPGTAPADPQKPIRQIFRLYNSKGFPSEEYAFDPSAELETRTLYRYDSKNNLLEKTDYGPQDDQLRRETYASDKLTASRTISLFGANDQLVKNTVYEYREDGAVRRETATSYDAGEQALAKTVFLYGAKGGRETELVFQGDLEKQDHEYRYSYKSDVKGNWTEERKVKLNLYEDKRFEDPRVAPQITKREIIYY